MSVAPVSYDVGCTFRMALSALDFRALDEVFASLQEEGTSRLPRSVPRDGVVVTRSLNMRYIGQGYQVVVDLPQSEELTASLLQRGFNEAYARLYGRTEQDQQVESVAATLHLTYAQAGYGERALPHPSHAAIPRTRLAYCPTMREKVPFKVFRRDELPAGASFTGPAIIEESDSSTVASSSEIVTVHASGCLMIDAAPRPKTRGDSIAEPLRATETAAMR
jgi:N-methylhydantoinase A